MLSRTKWIPNVALACQVSLLLASSAFGQTAEQEPNNSKAAANPVTLDGFAAAPANQLTGITTGSSGTIEGLASVDVWRIKTPAAAPGIYRHELVITSSFTDHTARLRGRSQDSGVITGLDANLQISSPSSIPSRAVAWYGFGKQEEIYCMIAGTIATTDPYFGTLTSTPVSPIVFAGTLFAGDIDFSASSSNLNSEIWLYDASFNAIVDGGNDDFLARPGAGPSRMVRALTPGTYYLAVSRTNLANNLKAAPDDGWRNGSITDFPNVIVSGSLNPFAGTTAGTITVLLSDSVNLVTPVQLDFVNLNGGPIGDIRFIRFQVIAAPFPIGSGSATPNPVVQGASTTISVNITPGASSSLSNITSVSADISRLTGNPTPDNLALTRVGTTSTWSGVANISLTAPVGDSVIPFSIVDSTIATPGPRTFIVNVIPVPPINDTCAGAITVSTGTPAVTADNTLATSTGDPVTSCVPFARGMWYTFQAPFTGVASINMEGSVIETPQVAVYTSCGGTQITCSLDGRVDFAVNSGQTIKILTGQFGPDPTPGPFNLNISMAAGACCNDNLGTCTYTLANACPTGSTFKGVRTLCSPSPCGIIVACCNTQTSACTLTTILGCPSPNTFVFDSPCYPELCTFNDLTCCIGSICFAILANDCFSQTNAGSVSLVGTSCNVPGVGNTPCCHADYNKQNGIEVVDIFAFLGDWFAASPYANFGNSGLFGAPDVTDIFGFLNAWFAGNCL